MKKKLKLEVWRSTMNQQERHYFVPKEGRGYQAHQYVFGYNPEVFPVKLAKALVGFFEEFL